MQGVVENRGTIRKIARGTKRLLSEEMCFCVTILIAFFHLALKIGNQSNRARNAERLI